MNGYYPLKGFESTYYLSKLGTINNANGLLIKPFKHEDGYDRITLYKNNRKHNYYLHRLVAKQFIPNPDKTKEVDHINRNRADNRVSNLRWVDRQGNCDNRVLN